MRPEVEVVWNGVNDGCGSDLLCTPPTVAHPPTRDQVGSVDVRALSIRELFEIERAVAAGGRTAAVARHFHLPGLLGLEQALRRLHRLRGGASVGVGRR